MSRKWSTRISDCNSTLVPLPGAPASSFVDISSASVTGSSSLLITKPAGVIENDVMLSSITSQAIAQSVADPEFIAVGPTSCISMLVAPFDLTVTKPAGIIENDILIAQFGLTAQTEERSITPPVGWTLIRNDTLAGAPPPGGFVQIQSFWKRATAAEPATYTFTAVGGGVVSGGGFIGRIAAYRNIISTGNPIFGHSGATDLTAVLEDRINIPSILGVPARSMLVISLWNSGDNMDMPWSTVPGMTERADSKCAASGNGFLALDDQPYESGGDTGVRSAEAPTVVDGRALLGQMIALIPQPLAAVLPTHTAPAGWTLIRTDSLTDSLISTLWWKRATAAEPATYTWTSSFAADSVGSISAYRNILAVGNPVLSHSDGSGAAAASATFGPIIAPENSVVYSSIALRNAVTEIFNLSTTWTVPSDITSVVPEVWGAGGGGGFSVTADGTGQGGGGGTYSKKNSFVVVPGNSETVTVGVGGTGGITDTATEATAGGDSWFSSIATVLAKGGGGGISEGFPPVNNEGLASAGVGDVKFSGGRGKIDAGGGGAGSLRDGAEADFDTPGYGGARHGGNGGGPDEVPDTPDPEDGNVNGGGGGGHQADAGPGGDGADGARGQVRVSYSSLRTFTSPVSFTERVDFNSASLSSAVADIVAFAGGTVPASTWNWTNGAADHINQQAVLASVVSETQIFEGCCEDVSDFQGIRIFAYSDVPSATDGLVGEWALDCAGPWRQFDKYTVLAGLLRPVTLPVRAPFFRIRYTNGAVAQSDFQLQTVLMPEADMPTLATGVPTTVRVLDSWVETGEGTLVPFAPQAIATRAGEPDRNHYVTSLSVGIQSTIINAGDALPSLWEVKFEPFGVNDIVFRGVVGLTETVTFVNPIKIATGLGVQLRIIPNVAYALLASVGLVTLTGYTLPDTQQLGN